MGGGLLSHLCLFIGSLSTSVRQQVLCRLGSEKFAQGLCLHTQLTNVIIS